MSKRLDDLWRKIDLGVAEEQEKIDGAVLAGESHDSVFVPRLLSLLTDQSGQARYYALQSLVLDLKQKGGEVSELCWNCSVRIRTRMSGEWQPPV